MIVIHFVKTKLDFFSMCLHHAKIYIKAFERDNHLLYEKNKNQIVTTVHLATLVYILANMSATEDSIKLDEFSSPNPLHHQKKKKIVISPFQAIIIHKNTPVGIFIVSCTSTVINHDFLPFFRYIYFFSVHIASRFFFFLEWSSGCLNMP